LGSSHSKLYTMGLGSRHSKLYAIGQKPTIAKSIKFSIWLKLPYLKPEFSYADIISLLRFNQQQQQCIVEVTKYCVLHHV
jgi:hypothetical protein